MKTKFYKICGVALALMLVFSLFGAFIPVNQVEADPGEVAWSGIVNPGNLLRTGLNMADVEVGPIAVTPDGATLFAAVQCESAIAGVAGAPGTFTLPDNTDVITLTAGPSGATGAWVVTAGTISEGPTGTFTLAAGVTQTFTATADNTAGTYDTFTAGSVTAAVTVDAGALGVPTFTLFGAWALLESTDGGYNWSATGLTSNPGPITGIAVSPYFPTDGTMYVAAGSSTTGVAAVFRSTDSGATFTELKGVPLEIGGSTPTLFINSIAMWPASPYPYIMVGTDTDVWVLQDMPFGAWMDQEINNAGPVNILEVAFAPDFATTNFIWAVIDTGVITATNSPGAWGTILANTAVLLAACLSADIAFPDGYDSSASPYLWVGLNDGGGNGGVWRVRGLGPPGPSQAILQLGGFGIGIDIRSIAVSGSMASATILAGDDGAATIYKTESGGLTWPGTAVLKQPTGVDTTYVLMAPDFATSGLAHVGTSDGLTTESAFQVSRNAGMSWNQTGLIDTDILAINDIAVVSCDTVFMATVTTAGFDLWKTTDATAVAPIWERVLTDTTVTVPVNTLIAGGSLDLVATSPEFDGDGVDDMVLVTNTGATVAVMKSTDGGDIFTPMGAPIATITALFVVDNTFAFTGAAGQVYRTDDGAYSWLAASIPPAGTVASFAASPDYANDSTLLIGNGAGAIYRSVNGGATFTLIAGSLLGATTATYVAFDAEYATNSIIYAAGDAIIERYDFTATALGWRDAAAAPLGIDKSMPTGVGAIVPADAFVITEVAALGDTGTITVLTGSITVLPTGNATIAGVGLLGPALTITAGMGAIPWVLADNVGDTLIITATANSTSGWFTPVVGNQTTAIVPGSDPNLNTSFFAVAAVGNNPFSLPDAAITGAAASVINGLLTSPDGTIYGSNALANLGVERSLNPRDGPPLPWWPTFEWVIDQLPVGATLAGLWLVVDPALDVVGSTNVLFSIDTANVQSVTYTDTLATTVVLTEPADGTVFPRETAVTMVWEELTGADTYQWQIATDSGFRLVISEGSSAYTSDSSGLLDPGRTYYWRVRVADEDGVGDPLLSRWSNAPAYESAAHWSFTTFLGERPWHPFDPMSGVSPSPGATDVPVKPTFQWNGADWATTYDLELADNSAFTGAIKKTLSATAWTCDPALDYNTTYYWKVKAVSDVTESEWTDVGVFTTVAEVVPPAKVYSCPQCGLEFSTEAALQAHWDKFHAPPTPVKAVTPAYIWAIIGVGALLIVAVLVLILRTRRVA